MIALLHKEKYPQGVEQKKKNIYFSFFLEFYFYKDFETAFKQKTKNDLILLQLVYCSCF